MYQRIENGNGTVKERQGYGVEVRPGMLVVVDTLEDVERYKSGVVLSVAEHGAFVRLDRPNDVSVVGVTWDDLTIKAAPPVPVSG